MTRQELFNTVAKHLVQQGERSEHGSNKSCMYRISKHGRELKCAVGILIDDDDYSIEMEGISSDDLFSKFGRLDSIARLKRHHKLVRALQIVHDNTPPEEWREDLREVAEQFKLKTNVLETA